LDDVILKDESMLLKDKVALVTGAGRGWGQAISLAYARQGARVFAVSRSQPELDKTAALIRGEGLDVTIMSVDVTSDDQMRRMTDDVLAATGGRLDVLVNNAAQLVYKPFMEQPFEEWEMILRVNLRGVVLGCKLFLDAMKARRTGSIINVSSNAGVRASAVTSAYCTAKFALEGFSKSLALELQPYNIAVNTITPGGPRIKPTSMTQEQYDTLSAEEQGRYDDPMLLTEAFVYLARQDGRGVTGERVSAWALSEQVRKEGWGTVYQRVRV
jgi:NAD(P)-dependent dehydrogenase (short-subunit alcohol dehydrogenase family)